ncbi:hypothetical protein KPP03845_200173 (plasmid) [Streptomyces xanthophaeus]|uniref:hypothetical protein n=1 Tax=Streptomyces xanthophaeus TaxID=67385 RepID=UPI00233F769D|nr:hypothetical protein [Streptomyces xanthophaeus]WCD91212.1 hypothetical protein KPP03845_200173 [Streptomyces xanthophaeus]
MNQYTDAPSDSFETLLLKAHPETALIHELGSRLKTLPLPITDWDDLVRKLQDEPTPELLRVPAPDRPCLPGELFPIRDEADLAVKLTATIRTFLRQARLGAGSPSRLTLPLHRRMATLADEAATGSSRRSGVFDHGMFLGAERADSSTEEASAWLVTLVLSDCATEEPLPWSWITDFSVTYLFDAYARFTAVIYEPYTMYAVLVMREGYVNRRFELNIGMAGTTQKICLHRA